MRSNEEMIKAVHEREAEMRRARRKRQNLWMGGGVAVCALVLIALLVVYMPTIYERLSPERPVTMQASALADSGVLGYAVIGIVAFLLGIAVTVFCVLLRSRRDEEKNGHDRDH